MSTPEFARSSPAPDIPTPLAVPANASGFRRWATRIGWGLAVAVPLWLAGGRLLTSTAGSLTPVYAATLTPVMLVLSLVALSVPARRPARYPSTRACVVLLISWACGITLGFTLPDTDDGAASVIGAWFGDGAEGAAAALSNPLGIIMLFTAVMGCVLAVRHSGYGDGSGAPRDTDEDEAQGTGHYPVLDV